MRSWAEWQEEGGLPCWTPTRPGVSGRRQKRSNTDISVSLPKRNSVGHRHGTVALDTHRGYRWNQHPYDNVSQWPVVEKDENIYINLFWHEFHARILVKHCERSDIPALKLILWFVRLKRVCYKKDSISEKRNPRQVSIFSTKRTFVIIIKIVTIWK